MEKEEDEVLKKAEKYELKEKEEVLKKVEKYETFEAEVASVCGFSSGELYEPA